MRLRSGVLRSSALLLALGVVGTSPLDAQRASGGGRPQDRAQLEQRVRARFAETVQRRLGLTDEQSAALGTVMEGLQGERMALAHDEQALRRRMEAILADAQASDDDARAVLERMGELRLREAHLFQEEQGKLLEILSPIQVVRFHALREQLAQRIQQ
ncbi:MAG TPA: Spy/CpxP family protein refolding chaperone, partial [Longimicrobiales bacterium]|nr:Spy/CpxP family protein refolding chaperone [Longimicrobiales bacterium]